MSISFDQKGMDDLGKSKMSTEWEMYAGWIMVFMSVLSEGAIYGIDILLIFSLIHCNFT